MGKDRGGGDRLQIRKGLHEKRIQWKLNLLSILELPSSLSRWKYLFLKTLGTRVLRQDYHIMRNDGIRVNYFPALNTFPQIIESREKVSIRHKSVRPTVVPSLCLKEPSVHSFVHTRIQKYIHPFEILSICISNNNFFQQYHPPLCRELHLSIFYSIHLNVKYLIYQSIHLYIYQSIPTSLHFNI